MTTTNDKQDIKFWEPGRGKGFKYEDGTPFEGMIAHATKHTTVTPCDAFGAILPVPQLTLEEIFTAAFDIDRQTKRPKKIAEFYKGQNEYMAALLDKTEALKNK